MTDDWLEDVQRFIDQWKTVGLATVDEHGRPYAANLWVARGEGLQLYFISGIDARHSHHIIRTGHAAITSYAETDDPMFIHGVQLTGRCVPIPAPPEGDQAVWQHAWDTFTGRFAFVAEQPVFRKAALEQCFFRFTPTWVRWLDSRKGFGFKIERNLAAAPVASK